MKFNYYYSKVPSLIFTVFGLVLLLAGIDLKFTGYLFKINYEVPSLATYILIFIGFLTFSGFLANLFKAKEIVISADENFLTVFAGNAGDESSVIRIDWKNITEIKSGYLKSMFRKIEGGHFTKALFVAATPGTIKRPPVILGRNRIFFEENEKGSLIAVNAWLDKGKDKIVEELKKLREKYSNLY